MEKAFRDRRRRQLYLAAIVLAAMSMLPFLVRDVYFQNVLILLVMYAALSQAWNILCGYCGQISLGHALYFGIGAYVSTLLFIRFGISPWAGMLAGGVVCSALALALGWPTFRLRGHYFTIATIVIAEIGFLLFLNWDWAGAAQGLELPVRGDSFWAFQYPRSKLPYFFFILGLAAVAWLATWAIEDSKWGYYWRAVKENPEAGESLGVNIFNSKMAAAAITAFFTAVGGAFYARFVSYIDPDSVMSFHFSLFIALPAVLGGIGTLWGPALGAAVLIPISEVTTSYIGGSGKGIDLIVYGAIVVFIALLQPEGLVSLFRFRRRGKAGG